jgi:hypothetical protein
MSIVRISKRLYNHAQAGYRNAEPLRGCMLTPDPEGQAYYFTQYNGYAVLADVAPGVMEVRGVFKIGTRKGFASAVVQWCKALGATAVQVDCYAQPLGISTAWRDAGLMVYKLVPWADELKPECWPAELGTPSIFYMRKIFGG